MSWLRVEYQAGSIDPGPGTGYSGILQATESQDIMSIEQPRQKSSNQTNIALTGLEHLYETAVPQPLIKVAVGILTWPIAQLSKPDRFKKHSVRKVISDGECVTAIEWEVTPDTTLGMPTMLSLRVLFALCKVASEQKRQTGVRADWITLPGWNQLCQLVGIEPASGNRTLLKHHLSVLHSTLVSSKQAFKTKSKAEGISDKFVLIPSIKFKGERDENGTPCEQTQIRLASPILDSLDNDYVKTIDLAFMAELDNETAQLLYTKVSYLLNKAMKRGTEYEDIDYQWLAESMGLTLLKDKWRVKQQLNPAFEALYKKSYIQKPEWWVDGFWKIRIRPGVRFEFGEQLQLSIRKAVVQKKKHVSPPPPLIPIQSNPPDDERQSMLIRLAARLNSGMKDLDPDIAAKHGWTPEEIELKAAELRR